MVHLFKMASRAMNRTVAASCRKLVAIQNISSENLNGIDIFDGRSSTFQVRKINTLCRQTNLLNKAYDYNGIRDSKLFFKNFTKGKQIETYQTKYLVSFISSRNFSLFSNFYLILSFLLFSSLEFMFFLEPQHSLTL